MEAVNLSGKVKTLLVFKISVYTKVRLVRTYAKPNGESFSATGWEFDTQFEFERNPYVVCRDSILISQYTYGGTEVCEADNPLDSDDELSASGTPTSASDCEKLFTVGEEYSVTNSEHRHRKIAFMVLSVDDFYEAAFAARQCREIMKTTSDGRKLSTHFVPEATVIACLGKLPVRADRVANPSAAGTECLSEDDANALDGIFPDAIWLNNFEVPGVYRAAKTMKFAANLNPLAAPAPKNLGLLFGGAYEVHAIEPDAIREIFLWVAAGVIATRVWSKTKDLCTECRSGKPLAVNREQHSCDDWIRRDKQKFYKSNELKLVLDSPTTAEDIRRFFSLIGSLYRIPTTWQKTNIEPCSRAIINNPIVLVYAKTWLTANSVANRPYAELARCIVVDMKFVDF